MNAGIVAIGSDVARALSAGRSVVALETTIFSELGLPRPHSVRALADVTGAVAAGGAVPALTGVIDGEITCGLDSVDEELICGPATKMSARDIGRAAAQQWTYGATTVSAALTIAAAKVELSFLQAVTLGILCNTLVCLAVWLTFSARSTVDKIAAIIFPITAFVAAGFEHSIANMYFIPIGLLIRQFDSAFMLFTGLELPGLTWTAFVLKNLIPVTLGNILGGSVLVAAVYWFIYLRPARTQVTSTSEAPEEPLAGSRARAG